MKKVLIIGSGKRAQGTIIPALFCLRETHEIVGVYSRTQKNLSLCGGQFQTTTVQSFEQFDFGSTDLMIVAITILNVAAVLKELSKFSTKHITLMLDTPILPFRHIFAAQLFRNFKCVLASEDTIALPPYLLSRSIIDSEKIGDVKKVYFFHSGYKFHALASLKILVGGSAIKQIKNKKLPKNVTLKTIDFENNTQAFLYEPRDYEKGTFLIEGTKGNIADYERPEHDAIRLAYTSAHGSYYETTVDGNSSELDELDLLYRRGVTDRIFNESFMNTMKIRALMSLVVSALDEQGRFRYAATTALQDSFIIWCADKMGYPIIGLTSLYNFILKKQL